MIPLGLPEHQARIQAWRRYLGFMLVANALWEVAQLPLYSIWAQSKGDALFAAGHCVLGDMLIATASLTLSLVFVGRQRWPAAGSTFRVAAVATILGALYTVFSEWMNLTVRQSWAYADWMPRVPPLGTGLSPLIQWLVLPPLGLRFAVTLIQVNGGARDQP